MPPAFGLLVLMVDKDGFGPPPNQVLNLTPLPVGLLVLKRWSKERKSNPQQDGFEPSASASWATLRWWETRDSNPHTSDFKFDCFGS